MYSNTLTKNLRIILKLPDDFYWSTFSMCLDVLFWDNVPIFIDAVRLEKHVVRQLWAWKSFVISYKILPTCMNLNFALCILPTFFENFAKISNYIICKVHISFQSSFLIYQVKNRVFFWSLWCEFWVIAYNRLKSIYHFSQPYQNRILKSVVFNFVTW